MDSKKLAEFVLSHARLTEYAKQNPAWKIAGVHWDSYLAWFIRVFELMMRADGFVNGPTGFFERCKHLPRLERRQARSHTTEILSTTKGFSTEMS